MLAALVGALSAAAPASAQDPGGCNANRMTLDIIRDKTYVKNGDVINYYVDIANVGGSACRVSNVTVWIQFPAPDGTSTGLLQRVDTNLDLPAQFPTRRYGPYAYTVNANPGVSRLEAKTYVVNGRLHDTPVLSPFNADKSIGTLIPTPGIEVTKEGSIVNGQAPANVTYTFRVYNRTNPPLTLDNVTVSDSLCPNVVGPVSGDDGDNRLQPAEVWVYTCSMTHPSPGEYPNTVTACGELILNGGPMPKVCDEANWKVTLTAPPPQVAVKPQSTTKAPCTLARANATTVRAGQLNTIRVRVRNVDAGTKVTLTLPGGKKVTATADKNGLATFRVRPTKSGTASIQAAECSDVERLSVKPARRVVAQRAPRVTG
ncbi:hypothetical protein [Solirubrobacter soli]|uniref:hypothetical protein n=1 Tax=Solirubrobacter soli TaxID=363832 RepID=UPI0004177500|nr:hypothetical protein [Solirubrobacter soli]